MDSAKLMGLFDQALPFILLFGLKIIGAIIVYIIGRWVIGVVIRFIDRLMSKQLIDATVQRYAVSVLRVILNIVLIMAILGIFGIETTSLVALIAGAGIAIGAAWSGLLSNFAAGIFLLILRPFKLGEYITGGGVEGTVTEIGLFSTTINTPDNVKTFVGNAKIMSGDIKNFTAHPFRRVELFAQLSGAADVSHAIALLKVAVSKIANITENPGVDVEILEFNEFGPKLAVRPYCHTNHYWQVYFDTNKTIADTLGAAGFPVATRPVRIYPV